MATPTIPISTEENLGDPIDIRMDIIHPEPADVVAFPATTVVRTLAQHGEAIQGIQEQLVGVPIQEELMALRFRIEIAEAEIASLRARNRTTEAIEKITRNRERQAREKMERQIVDTSLSNPLATRESIQAKIGQALLQNSTNRDESHNSHEGNRRNVQTVRPYFYADFTKCQPLDFKGTEDIVGLTRWIEKIESVFNIRGCAIENKVEFATCTLLRAALTWWNGQIRTLGPEAYVMTWEGLKKKMTDKYCPQGEIQKLEVECRALGYFKRDCPKLKNKDGGNGNAQGWVYAVGNAEKSGNASRNPDSNVVAGNSYDVELADGKVVGVDTILRGCTLNFLNHPFNIDLMLVELGSSTLRSTNGRESRLTIISCSKAQEYMEKGCQVFWAQISAKKEEDKSEGKQIKDVPIVRDFPKVFPEDFPGLPPTRPVEF
ncbi:hypothetical protein Tco_1195548 [Tanacetum coccineum]